MKSHRSQSGGAILLNFISVWHMPLLFFLAGCSTYFALRKRSGGQYASERVKRLLVRWCSGSSF